jgi:AAA domain/Nuclease-related domain
MGRFCRKAMVGNRLECCQNADIQQELSQAMATLHPTCPAAGFGAGYYRELDVLRSLEDGLPVGYDLFHNVDWSGSLEGRQQVGEIDIAVVSPMGHLLLIEVKSGALEEGEAGLSKRYANRNEALDVGRQLRRHHSAILSRLSNDGLRQVRVGTLLVLPDHRVSSPSLAHPAERVVDASSYPELCQRVRELMPQDLLPSGVRERLLDFLSNRFAVLPDVSSRIGQVGRTSTALSSGLATWVPAIGHESGLFVVEATAGSGKTQLALALMRQADRAGQRCAYVCFNRALADHMIGIAPPSAQVMTFHEACVEHARRCGTEPDFSQPGIYAQLAEQLAAAMSTMAPRWDLLILDETQDFEPDWVQTMTGLLRAGGRAYLLGDLQQRIYWREDFGSSTQCASAARKTSAARARWSRRSTASRARARRP